MSESIGVDIRCMLSFQIEEKVCVVSHCTDVSTETFVVLIIHTTASLRDNKPPRENKRSRLGQIRLQSDQFGVLLLARADVLAVRCSL